MFSLTLHVFVRGRSCEGQPVEQHTCCGDSPVCAPSYVGAPVSGVDSYSRNRNLMFLRNTDSFPVFHDMPLSDVISSKVGQLAPNMLPHSKIFLMFKQSSMKRYGKEEV